ncbi:hypothetical protein [Methylomonas sp. TEB]|uniref:hypothetical protein n=2 Tax=unclassified Methylomonas TaxID=2608980 RepID=UPI0039F46CD8
MKSKSICRARIISALDKHMQRATYGAVAGVIQLPARSVMQGLDKNQRNSWVVSNRTLLPTGYSDTQIHPQHLLNSEIIETPEELAAWLKEKLVDLD